MPMKVERSIALAMQLHLKVIEVQHSIDHWCNTNHHNCRMHSKLKSGSGKLPQRPTHVVVKASCFSP